MNFPPLQNPRHISTSADYSNETSLVAALQARDKRALEYLYDHYSGALYGVVLRVVQKEAIAQEVLQDAFLKIWDKIQTYDPAKGRLFTWMLNVTRNLAIDKTRSREISQLNKTGDLDNLVGKGVRAGFTEQAVDAIGVQELLKVLPDDQQRVIDYLYLRGYTQSELAEESGIPLGTVKTRLRLAMQQLRTMLKLT